MRKPKDIEQFSHSDVFKDEHNHQNKTTTTKTPSFCYLIFARCLLESLQDTRKRLVFFFLFFCVCDPVLSKKERGLGCVSGRGERVLRAVSQ